VLQTLLDVVARLRRRIFGVTCKSSTTESPTHQQQGERKL